MFISIPYQLRPAIHFDTQDLYVKTFYFLNMPSRLLLVLHIRTTLAQEYVGTAFLGNPVENPVAPAR